MKKDGLCLMKHSCFGYWVVTISMSKLKVAIVSAFSDTHKVNVT